MLFTHMRKSMKVIIYVVVVTFAASLLYIGYSGRLPVGAGALGAAVATINGEKIGSSEFNELYLQIVSLQEASGRTVAPSQVEALKAQLLNQMINGKLVLQAAKDARIKVTNQEVQKAYDEYLKQYPSEKAFQAALKQRNLSPRDFRGRLHDQKLVEKMVALVQLGAKIGDADLAKAYEQVHPRHILLKVDKPADDAAVKAKAEALVKQLKGGADFAKLAKQLSADPGSKDKGGDLGFFGHGQMVAEFEKAAFALRVNEISDPVKTSYGYHVIQVLERKDAQGPDFEKAKPALRKQLQQSQGQQVFNKWFTDLRKKAKIEIKDAQLAAYNAAADGNTKKAKELYQEALKQQPQNGYLYGDLARLADQDKKPDEALKYYEDAVKYAPGEAVFHFSLGELYQKKNETEKAVAAFQKASDLEPKNVYLHYALLNVFKELKRDDLSKKEEEKLNAIVKANGQNQTGTSQSGQGAASQPTQSTQPTQSKK
jgi:parvulin-like peptidyl-prolyl isomerase